MRDELKYTPDKCMEQAAVDIAGYNDTAVRSSHGVGKTALGSCLMLTAMNLVPNLVALQLSPTWQQVVEIFWNEARKWAANSKIMPILFEFAPEAPKMWSTISKQTWYARGIASNKPGNVEGRHGASVFLLVDEAKAVDDKMIEAVQGALTSKNKGSRVWSAYLSTPSTPGGKFTLFYKAFTRDKAHWKRHKISAEDSPQVSKEWIDRMIRNWGIDSQIVQARVFAEFPEAGDDILISLQLAEQFYDENAQPSGFYSIGIDVGRYGPDESVISVYHGSTLVALIPFEKKSTTDVIAAGEKIATQYGARVIVVDDVGVGGGVTDGLAEKFDQRPEVTVIGLTVNAKSNDEKVYVSLGDEIWWLFSRALAEKRTNSLVQDEILEGQMTAYRKKFTADNRISIIWPEKKSDRPTSESNSPDRADSVVMGWFASTMCSAIVVAQEQDRVLKEAEEKRKSNPDYENIDASDGLEARGILKQNF